MSRKQYCYAFLVAGFLFGIPERIVSQDVVSALIGLVFSAALSQLAPTSNK